MKAFVKGNYKILRLPIPFATGQWQLYDLEKDPGETTDISEKLPEIRDALIKDWNDYAKRNELFDHKGHYDSIYRAAYSR